MTSLTERRCPRLLWWLAALASLAGCSQEPSFMPPAEPLLAVGLAVSATEAAPGDSVTIQIIAEPAGGTRIGSLFGTLRFDETALRYLGQPLAGDAPIVANDGESERGRLQLATLRLLGLPRNAAEFRFEVLRRDYSSSLRFELEEAVTPGLKEVKHVANRPPGVEPARYPGPVSRLTISDWAEFLGYADPPSLRVPGQGTVYGDVTLSGGINGLDVLAVLNVTVGNLSVLTDAGKDMVIAGNVAPFNLPGLGEADDANPPGRNADGSYDLTGLDGLALANEGVGNDQPVVGEAIPGRTPRPFRVVLSGPLAASRILTRDTIYELQGNVIVPAGMTLTIKPGTRIEGDAATRGALIVARAGNLNWQGTRVEPIVFTCTTANPLPGCWGGVVVNGLALLNHRDPGLPGLCPEKVSIGSTELYGGCLVEDTTGVIDYVRIEHGGKPAGGGPLPGLALLGVGSGTRVDHLQVHGSQGDGLYISGGNVNLRHMLLTGNALAGLSWDHGWGGNGFGGSAQFIQVQVPVGGTIGIRGSNLLSAPNAGPRSQPDLYNVTVIGAGAGGGTGTGMLLENGTAGILRDVILQNSSGAGLDLNGTDVCAQATSDSLVFSHSIVFNNSPGFSGDADCIDEAAYALNPSRANRTVDPGLRVPGNTLTPDTRPAFGSAATTGSIAPPSNLFFDLTAEYIGAVVPATFIGADIPWYAGWSRGWAGATP